MMVVADPAMRETIGDGLEAAGISGLKNVVFIRSPVVVEKDGGRTFVEVFPLWLEYYKYKGWLNRPWKIVVIGVESEYEDLPYYVTACLKRNTWEQVERIIKEGEIDYSQVPPECSGKDSLKAFFHGHGEGNIKGLLGKVTDYMRNGILMMKEGESAVDISNYYLKPAALHLERLKHRWRKYNTFFEYLPWEKEVESVGRMITGVENFFNEPLLTGGRLDKVLNQVNQAFDSISRLMKIHHIVEKC